jgi:starch synthase (maltosyl-transferring)
MRETKTRGSRRRVVIEGLSPEIDAGRFPIKRTVGEKVVVEADIFADGHDALSAVLRYRRAGDRWREAPMELVDNDRWRGSFPLSRLGCYHYTVRAWIDRFGSWRGNLQKKVQAGQEVSVDLLAGAEIVEQTIKRAPQTVHEQLRAWADRLASPEVEDAISAALEEELAQLMRAYPDTSLATNYERELSVVVDRERARFGAWYELFPRSCSEEPGRHGTFADCQRRLPYVAAMGFDIVYLPPIHPIGRTHRKGKNNTSAAVPEDVGSVWAIGGAEGGHKAVHPRLGTLEDFDRLVAAAGDLGLEIALDLAYQCSPDHPYIREHPEWFRRRPDGSLQYAENPPKRYEDIYPFDFECEAAEELWEELASIVEHWISHGVRIFRVDNPHTKSLAFWEWLIGRVKASHPDAIFLSEAFTRPKMMYRLAKLGFTQSYTYFTWRHSRAELTQYFTELTRTQVREHFRPNLWPNTPDILTEGLQLGGRPSFVARLVLAATLGANYGIYGPAFELCENRPLVPGREEYLDSEKYEIRHWDLHREDSLAELIGRINGIRRQNPALHGDWRLTFLETESEALIAYAKSTEDFSNVIVVVVNLDPHVVQSGWVTLPLEELGIDAHAPYQMHDLITDSHFRWQGPRNYVQLDPHVVPAHVFRARRHVATEHGFEYFV